ncbi:MAG: cysteine desulfurase family protein [Thermoanaerobaculia bacterium]
MAAAYFDHNATTPLDARVREAMLPWLGERWGNAASAHAFGRGAREAVETAREAVARLIGGRPEEIVFTASGTEANNAVLDRIGAGDRLVLSAFEHPSIDRMADRAAARGAQVERVRPDRSGVVSSEAVLSAAGEGTTLVCLMLANNEVGTLQPVAEVTAELKRRGVPLLCDAVQAIGKVPVSVEALGVDYLTLGAHKFYGPLGGAALWIRDGAPFEPYLVGGSQERRRRAGTVNVAAIAGLGRAAELAAAEGGEWAAHCRALRDRFEAGLAGLPDVVVHGAGAGSAPQHDAPRVPVEAQSLMIRLDMAGHAVSTGSACSSGAVHVSRPSPPWASSRTRPWDRSASASGRATTRRRWTASSIVPAVALAALRPARGVGA